MDFEWFKYVTPLVGVGLGVFITPYLDNKKSKKESKFALDCFYAELDDYFSESTKYVKSYHDCYMKSKKSEMGTINEDEKLLPLIFHPKIEFLTIEMLIEKSFLDLTAEQRKAVKALKLLTHRINEFTENLSKLRTIEEFKEAKSQFYSATSTCSSFYYLLSRLKIEKERFIYFNDTTEEICKKTMDSIGLSFDDSVFGQAHNKAIKQD